MRLRARCNLGSGRVVVLAAALVTALSMQLSPTAASASSAVNSRFFGMHAPGLETAFPNTRVGAVNLTTNNVYWPQLQTAPGPLGFDFSKLDQLVGQARANGAQPLLVLGLTPQWASSTPATPSLGSVPSLAAWREYVTAVATQYTTSIDYQIWPEANAGTNWQGTSAELARLVKIASKIIHGVAPTAIVLSPAMVIRKPVQVKKMTKFFAQKVDGTPVGHFVDAVALDAYPLMDGTPEDSAALIRAAHRILADKKVTAPVWNVEINYGVAGSHLEVPPLPAKTQSSYVVRNSLLNAAYGVKRVYWLGWARYNTLGIQLVETDGVTPTAAGAALAQVQRWMLGRQVRSCARDRKSRIWTCTLVQKTQNKQQLSWVYWRPSGSARVHAPKGARRVETLTGLVKPTAAGKALAVTSTPIWVHH